MSKEPIVFKILPYDDTRYNLITDDPRIPSEDSHIDGIVAGKLINAMTMVTGLFAEDYDVPIYFETERF